MQDEDPAEKNSQGHEDKLRNTSPIVQANLIAGKLQSATTRNANDKASPDVHRLNGMTLEDDVESMLSDQFANSSEQSYFKVRLHSNNVG